MKIGIVPASLLRKAGRMDADFFIGNEKERKVVLAEENLRKAQKRFANAKAALKRRDEERAKLGIKILG